MPPRPLGAEAAAVRALMSAGVPAKLVERAIQTIDVDENDDAHTLDVKVAAAKAELPALFAGAVTPAPFGNTQPAPAGAAKSLADYEPESRQRYPRLVGPAPEPAV